MIFCFLPSRVKPSSHLRRIGSVWQDSKPPVRLYSKHVGLYQRAQVPVHNGGLVDVDIYLPHNPQRPPASSSTAGEPQLDAAATTHVDILFHFPALPPNLLNSTQSQLVSQSSTSGDLARLSKLTSLPVVQPRYRLSPSNPYPTPTHDIAVAYDWAIEWMKTQWKVHSAPNKAPQNALVRQEQIKVGLTGDLVGGGLALALGLTECRITDPARVVGIYTHEPLLDWLFEQNPSLQRTVSLGPTSADTIRRANQEEAVDALHLLRDRSFPGRHPFKYFDPFASPMHFLRSPSSRVPDRFAEAASDNQSPLAMSFDDVDEDAQDADEKDMEEEHYASTMAATEPVQNNNDTTITAADTSSSNGPGILPPQSKVKRPMALDDPRRFKRPLRYPPADHAQSMILPRVHVSTHPNSLLRSQAEEFVRLLRRGLIRGKGYKMSKNVEKMIMNEQLLHEEEQKQTTSEAKDERLQYLMRGMTQFELQTKNHSDIEHYERVAAWFSA